MGTETVTTKEVISSVVLIPESGQLIFSSSKILVLPNGQEIEESSTSETAVIAKDSKLYADIIAERANVVVEPTVEGTDGLD